MIMCVHVHTHFMKKPLLNVIKNNILSYYILFCFFFFNAGCDSLNWLYDSLMGVSPQFQKHFQISPWANEDYSRVVNLYPIV